MVNYDTQPSDADLLREMIAKNDHGDMTRLREDIIAEAAKLGIEVWQARNIARVVAARIWKHSRGIPDPARANEARMISFFVNRYCEDDWG